MTYFGKAALHWFCQLEADGKPMGCLNDDGMVCFQEKNIKLTCSFICSNLHKQTSNLSYHLDTMKLQHCSWTWKQLQYFHCIKACCWRVSSLSSVHTKLVLRAVAIVYVLLIIK